MTDNSNCRPIDVAGVDRRDLEADVVVAGLGVAGASGDGSFFGRRAGAAAATYDGT